MLGADARDEPEAEPGAVFQEVEPTGRVMLPAVVVAGCQFEVCLGDTQPRWAKLCVPDHAPAVRKRL